MRILLMRDALICSELVSLGISVKLLIINWQPWIDRGWMNLLNNHFIDSRSRLLFLALSLHVDRDGAFHVGRDSFVADSWPIRSWNLSVSCELRQRLWWAVITWFDRVKLRRGIKLLNCCRNFRLGWNWDLRRYWICPRSLMSANLKAFS